MSWSYDGEDLSTESHTGRVNSVRFLVGDVEFSDQQVQDEEISFALAQSRNNIYLAGSFIAGVLAAKCARDTDVSLGSGAISEDASAKSKAYLELKRTLRAQATRQGYMVLGASSGTLTPNLFTQLQFNF